MVVDVEWETDGDLEALAGLKTRWVIPWDAFNDADGESADVNMCVSDYLSDETGWLVNDWDEVETVSVDKDVMLAVSEILGSKLIAIMVKQSQNAGNKTLIDELTIEGQRVIELQKRLGV
jgi:hypothetical protein